MNCEKCGRKTDILTRLGSDFNKNGKAMATVCVKCRDDWIRFLDLEILRLIKQQSLPLGTLYMDLEDNLRDKLWLATFRKWMKWEFIFR